jgi:hypothetical protein
MTPYSQLLVHSMHEEHRHSDGTWGRLEPSPAHDVAERDPERAWQAGRVYQCTRCSEEVRISIPADDEPGHAG